MGNEAKGTARLDEIRKRDAYPWIRFEEDSAPDEARHLPRGIALTIEERDALLARVERLEQLLKRVYDYGAVPASLEAEICAALNDEEVANG